MASPHPSTPSGSRRDLPRARVPLTPEEQAQVRTLAERWGCSEAEAIRRAVALAVG